VLQDASGSEFQLFFDVLRKLPHSEGSTELLDVVVDQIESNPDFKPEEQHVSLLLTCLRLAQPYYQKGQSSVRMAQYLADKVFPVFTQLSEQQQSQLIKQTAELTPYASGDDAKVLLKPVYDLLLVHAPLTNEAKTHFTITEAVLLMFHHLAPKAAGQLRSLCGITIMTGQPSDLVGEPSVDRRKDLDARLKLLEESTKAYVAKVRHALDILQKEMASTKDAAKKEELNTKKVTLDVALKTTQNVQTLAQGLLKPTPTFLKLGPSWKSVSKSQPHEAAKATTPTGKRRILTLTNKPAQPKPTTTVPRQHIATTAASKPAAVPKPTVTSKPAAASVAKPAAAAKPLATTDNTSEKKQRPSFSQVYVPPSRQGGVGGGGGGVVKRKESEDGNDTSAAANKKFKGRGTRTFS